MPIVQKILLLFFVLQYAYLSFVQWRAVGVRHATLHRVIELVALQIGMVLISSFILQRINAYVFYNLHIFFALFFKCLFVFWC